MKLLNTKTLAVAAAMLATVMPAQADMAKPGVWQWPQADGTELNVRVIGDENHHFCTSEDGYVLVKENGNFYYGVKGESGNVVASAVRASNVSARTAHETTFLSTIDKEAVLQTLYAENSGTREGMRRAGQGLFSGTNFPCTGEQRGVVILVAFQDKPFSTPDPQDYFYRMLNEEGFSDYTATGSARDYFLASSAGAFDFHVDVYGPVTLSKGYAYYGGDNSNGKDVNVREMIIEACTAMNSEIDFSQYDRDGDGKIDNVCVIYAGYGQSSYPDDNCIWPHRSTVGGNYVFDGKKLNGYSCNNEWQSTGSGMPVGPGTFCHEFSHVLGLPDTYSTSYNSGCFTPGDWDIMAGGNYNNNGFSPPLYCAQERYALGWLDPIVISGSMNATLEPLIDSNKAYIIKTAKSTEYYLLENRQHKGWDRYLPAHGMLVWHIDFNQSLWDRNQVCNNPNHQYVDIVEADNTKTEASRGGDTFPGSAGITSFTDDTTPSMKAWTGAKLNLPITEIAENAPDGVITFKVAGGAAPAPGTSAKAATSVTPRSFVANWSAASGAEEYILSVFTRNGSDVSYVSGYEKRNVGTKTSLKVEGLEPSTSYIYTVTVSTGDNTSLPSNEVSVTTGALTQEYVLPVALDATNIKDNSFTANWEAVDGADSYVIDIYRRYVNGAEEMYNGFDAKINEWYATANCIFSSTKIFAGLSTPSLQLPAGAFISTPMLEAPVRSFSFWNRGKSTDASARILVEALVDGSWATVDSYAVCTKSGGATNVSTNFPAGTSAVRIYFDDPKNKGQFYVDDIVVNVGGSETKMGVSGYSNLNVGNVTTLAVSGMIAGTEHFYTVKAIKNGVASMASAPKRVLTTGTAPQGLAGDANGDFAIDATDISYMIDVMIGAEHPDFVFANADLNNDGSIDAADIGMLINLILGQ